MKKSVKHILLASSLPIVLTAALQVQTAAGAEHEEQARETDSKSAMRAEAASEPEGKAGSSEELYDNQELKDAWLHGKIEVALALNPYLNPFTIDTDVKDGVATLNGQVESAIDRELAEEVARSIEGIEEVENNLAVEESTKASAKESSGNSLRQRVEDLTISAKLKTKLLANSQTQGLAIDVTTRNNEVSLKGEVSSAEEKSLAGLIAKNTSGVERVDNQLEVVE